MSQRKVITAMSQRKVITGNFFEIEIFILKYILDRSESISMVKKFSSKIFVLSIFSTYDPHFSIKWLCPQRKVIMRNFFRNRDFHFKIPFGRFWIDSDKKLKKIFFCYFFDQKWPKLEIFEYFWWKFFSKEFLYPLLELCIVIFELSYTFAPLPFDAIIPSEQIHPPLPPPSSKVHESGLSRHKIRHGR